MLKKEVLRQCSRGAPPDTSILILHQLFPLELGSWPGFNISDQRKNVSAKGEVKVDILALIQFIMTPTLRRNQKVDLVMCGDHRCSAQIQM